MKKHVIFAILGLFILQVVKAQNPIPNPGFENWVDTKTATGWNGLSIKVIISITISGPERVTDKHSGTYAAKLATKSMDLSMLSMGTVTVPGFMTLGAIDVMSLVGVLQDTTKTPDMSSLSQYIGNGVHVTDMVKNVKGYFKYQPQGVDSMLIAVYLTKAGVPVAAGAFTNSKTVDTYTQFTANVQYLPGSEGQIPDSMNIVIVSSAGFGNEGSALFIDDLEATYGQPGTDACQGITATNDFYAYPNPAKERFTITLVKENVKNTIDVYNLNGVKVYSKTAVGKTTEIDLSNQKAGTYIVKVTGDGVEMSQNIILTK